jgi:alkyldihydroxyacetonephosphate synthase
MAERSRSWWGWGYEDEALDDAHAEGLRGSLSRRFDQGLELRPAPRLEDIALPASRVEAPDPLADLCATDTRTRAAHTYGKSFRDVVRGSRGEFSNAPDIVAYPTTEAQVVSVLEWCADKELAAMPFGGGSSVVGGVECREADQFSGVVTIDLTKLDRVLEVDSVSRAARIQGGALGPVLEKQLRPHGYTLRHFPQSFEFSTLGGWLATRSGGHYASVYTHIDDMVESLRVITPHGPIESRRLPGSGAGPSPDRLFLGSEGSLGVITEAWMRVQDRPIFRGSAGVRFADFAAAVEATRAVAQSGLFPTNCRLLDPAEAMTSAGVDDGSALLVLGFESADHPVDAWITRAVELCRDHGGADPDGVALSGPAQGTSGTDSGTESGGTGREGAVGAWRNAFLRAPYGRDALVRMSVIVETFETACTWDRFPSLHAAVTEQVERSLAQICGGGWVTCRFTHVYPDGAAPYFSVIAPGRPGDEISQWDEIKTAVSDVLSANGATITHHHAVGRDHDRWYRQQRPDGFGAVLAAAKQVLDPNGILNPGVIT